MSENLDHYKLLTKQMMAAREAGDEELEDQLLEALDDAWDELSFEEREGLRRTDHLDLVEPT